MPLPPKKREEATGVGKAKGGDRGPDCGPSACAPTLADAAVAVEGAKKLNENLK